MKDSLFIMSINKVYCIMSVNERVRLLIPTNIKILREHYS